MDQNSFFCAPCNRQVMCVRKPVNHVLHLLITLTTCGLWLFVWLGVCLFRPPYRCQVCGWWKP